MINKSDLGVYTHVTQTDILWYSLSLSDKPSEELWKYATVIQK